MSSRPAGHAAFVFVFIAVLVDSIGFGIILPVLPRLIMALTRVMIPWFGGERRAAAAGMVAAVVAYLGYALVPQGWMMYVVSLSTAVFALTFPSMNALASRQIPANAQGELQGAVASLYSLSSILGPPLMTQVFGHFSRPGAAVHFPGAAFVTAALLTVLCGVLFSGAMRLAPQHAAAAAPSQVSGG